MQIHKKAVQLWQLPLLRGVFSFSAMRYSTKFLILIRLALVARFLGPRELGLFGLATMAVAITEVFTQTGINLVLLKNPEKLKSYIHTAWAVSIVRGLCISLLILLAAPFLARFYQDDALTSYLVLAAGIPLLRGFLNPAIITFQQELQFGKESLLRTVLQLVDITSGLVFVLITGSGLGLVAGIAVGTLLELVLSFWLFKLKPDVRKAEFTLVKKLYSETKYIIGHGILNYLTEHSDDLLIGRLLGTAGLGLYQTAYKWASAVTIDVGYILGQIAYPIYAQAQKEKRSVTTQWRNSSMSMAVLFCVGGLGFLAFTDVFVHVVLGEEWLSIVPAIRILFMAGVIKAFITAWSPLAVLADNLQHYIVLSLIIVLVMLPAIWYFAPRLGTTGAAFGILFGLLVVAPYALWITWSSLKKLDARK